MDAHRGRSKKMIHIDISDNVEMVQTPCGIKMSVTTAQRKSLEDADKGIETEYELLEYMEIKAINCVECLRWYVDNRMDHERDTN